MNLIDGKLIDAKDIPGVLNCLPERLAKTLTAPPLGAGVVIEACDRLAKSLGEEQVLPVLAGLGMDEREAKGQYEALRAMFSRAYLTQRLLCELGEGWETPRTRVPYGGRSGVTEAFYPLGVLFHVAAGNMDGLPVYSVIEGLLAGNINLLKLPSVDGGLSVMILQKLVELEPRLASYVYVFELSSGETDSMQRLAALADAIVVWGGDEAVLALRRLAPPNVRVIEWGHKLSFAYVTPAGATKTKLKALAEHICATNGLLCSSCQGVFFAGESKAEQQDFCEKFLPVLEEAAKAYPVVPLSARAQNTLQLYSRELAGAFGDRPAIYRGKGVSIVLEPDGMLTPSLQFRSIWVRGLARERIVPALHGYKNHLQTAALLCAPREWETLRDALWRAGVVKVCEGGDMSGTYCGAAHDGEYPLRRYTRVVAAHR